jgi:hypothetical protein
MLGLRVEARLDPDKGVDELGIQAAGSRQGLEGRPDLPPRGKGIRSVDRSLARARGTT